VGKRVGEVGQGAPVGTGLSGSGCPGGIRGAPVMASNGARAVAGGVGPGGGDSLKRWAASTRVRRRAHG
jgi:hypothetical protein